MRAVVTRVDGASVDIEGVERGAIGRGYLVLLGVARGDAVENAVKMADKICNLRVFEDQNGKMNLDIGAVSGEMLIVSNFTLCADTSSRRPGFTTSAPPDIAEPLYEAVAERVRARGVPVRTGVFGADMLVRSDNNGPVTIILET